jgi:integrase
MPPKKTEKKWVMGTKTEYSSDELLDIVAKWSTPASIKRLIKTQDTFTKAGEPKVVYPGIRDFYEEIEMKQNMTKVQTLSPFFDKVLRPAFNPKKVKLPAFRKFIAGIGRLVNETEFGMDGRLAAKKFIKRHLKIYHADTRDDKDLYVKAWHDAELNVQKDEFKQKNEQAQKKVDEKNRNVFYIAQAKVEAFYRSFCYNESPDLIDKIITVQATMGLRLIEALSSNVSNFRLVPKSDRVEQLGTAKMVRNKYETSSDKIVPKSPIVIDGVRFMEALTAVRKETDKFKSLSNEKMREKYNGKVNLRIQEYLRAAGIPEHNELKSSHGLRRLYVSFGYSLRDEQNLTFHQFIKDNLGHESNSSTQNYNTIKITTDKILDKDSAVKLNSTYSTTVRLEREVDDLKQEVHDIAVPPATYTPAVQEVVERLPRATKMKFQLIKKAMAEGKTSYAQLEKVAIPGTTPQKFITRNIIAKYKKINAA